MTQTASNRDWDGWELWYFGSDYLSTVEVPAEHWRVAPAPVPELSAWVFHLSGDTCACTPSPPAAFPWPADAAALGRSSRRLPQAA
jgi:hypothetical protein